VTLAGLGGRARQVMTAVAPDAEARLLSAFRRAAASVPAYRVLLGEHGAVPSQVVDAKDKVIIVNNPSEMPEPSSIDRIEEPFIRAQIITLPDYIGNIMSLCLGKRGVQSRT